MVNLTITVFMIFQGISPSFWGGLADSWGRRPIYITTFFIYMCSCIGLACTQNYPMLLMLRMVQAFGSGSAAAISAGSIGKQKKNMYYAYVIYICYLHIRRYNLAFGKRRIYWYHFYGNYAGSVSRSYIRYIEQAYFIFIFLDY